MRPLEIAFATLATLAGATAQESPSLQQLAGLVEAAHYPDGAPKPIESFRCSLELRLLEKQAENAGRADLDVAFLLWRRSERRAQPLIRYVVRSSEQPIERGRDQHGPWQLQRGETIPLDGGQHPTDLEQCNRHTNLARQLLRFLRPGEVLRSLQKPTAVTRTEQPSGRRRIDCWTVAGELTSFPLLRNAGEDVPVRLEVHVDANDHTLFAIDACPLVEGAPVEQRGERIVLHDLQARDGLLVPLEIVHQFRDEHGVLQPYTRASFAMLQLGPELTVADFDRTLDADGQQRRRK